MRILPLLLIALLLAQGVSAQSYSCRDKLGKLHFSDNLSNLPPECLATAKELKPRKTENLNFVPAAPVTSDSTAEVERQVREVEREEQSRKRLAEQLEARAQGLVAQYQAATSSKRQALRSWNYSSREKIQQADRDIQQARDGKQQLLDELPRARLATESARRVRALLEQIAE